MKKKLSVILTVLLMTVTLTPLSAIQADAASRDVTKELSGNQNIKKLSKMIAAYTTAMDLSENSTTETVKVKLNNGNKLSIAGFIRYNYKDDYGYTAAELRSETRRLFGKSASVSQIKNSEASATMLVCTADQDFVSDPYMYCGGEFGDTVPGYQIKKITKTGKNTYTVTIKNKIGSYGEKGSTVIGTTTLKLKKSSASKYGYIIKGITYKYNGQL